MVGIHQDEPRIYPGKRFGDGDYASLLVLVIVNHANAFAMTTLLTVNVVRDLLPQVSSYDRDFVDFLNS